MLDNLKIMWHQGKQYIPDVTRSSVPGVFRGRPVISKDNIDEASLVELCPTKAISANPVSIDLGKCTFCGECAIRFPDKIKFTSDYKLSVNEREQLIVKDGDESPLLVNPSKIRKEIRQLFGSSLKLRQVSAGGDNSCEWELNASNN